MDQSGYEVDSSGMDEMTPLRPFRDSKMINSRGEVGNSGKIRPKLGNK